jgi:uncharacterized protein (TIGR03000 family)
MRLRHSLLAIVCTAALASQASAQFFGGGMPFGGSPFGYGGNPLFGGWGGYPGYGGYGGYGGFGVPTIWQNSPIRAYTTSSSVVRPVVPPDSVLYQNPYFNQWANQNGYYLRPGETAPRYRSSLYPATPVDQSDYATLQAPASDNRAQLQVRVPSPNALVYFDGTQMTQTGTVRDFVTPPLTPGRDYSFNIRMVDGGGQPVNQTVIVRAGGQQTVDFTGPR